MWKRILLVAALVGLVGVLFGGAVYRTLDRTGLVVEAQGRGLGHEQRAAGEPSDNGLRGAGRAAGRGSGRAGSPGMESDASGTGVAQGLDLGSGRGMGAGSGGSRGGGARSGGNGTGGQAQGNSRGAQSGTEQNPTEESITYEGVVATADRDALLLRTDNGTEIMVEGRAWRFAQEQGFWADPDDALTFVGFHEGSEFKVSRMDNGTSGQGVLLRDRDGRPMWAGSGR
jgi:hypothetical protein